VRQLLGLQARVTIQCRTHGSHSAIARGPFLAVIDSVRLLRDICADQDRWVLTEYQALDEVPEMSVSEWE